MLYKTESLIASLPIIQSDPPTAPTLHQFDSIPVTCFPMSPPRLGYNQPLPPHRTDGSAQAGTTNGERQAAFVHTLQPFEIFLFYFFRNTQLPRRTRCIYTKASVTCDERRFPFPVGLVCLCDYPICSSRTDKDPTPTPSPTDDDESVRKLLLASTANLDGMFTKQRAHSFPLGLTTTTTKMVLTKSRRWQTMIPNESTRTKIQKCKNKKERKEHTRRNKQAVLLMQSTALQ